MHNRDKEANLSVDFLRSCIRYDELTGATFWRERPEDHFTSDGVRHTAQHICAFWNSKFAGKPTAVKGNSKGYLFLRLSGRLFLVHRIAWAIFHGKWPDGEIDHIDGNTSNNRIENLRSVDRVTNTRNSGFRSHNTSGVCGVYRLKSRNRLVAYIRNNTKGRITKFFPDCEQGLLDAAEWRKEKMKELGYHKNHGKRR